MKEANEYEIAARRAKVRKLADVLEEAIRNSGEDFTVCMRALGSDPTLREQAEKRAGVKPCSTTTWLQIFEELAYRLSRKPRHRWFRRIRGK